MNISMSIQHLFPSAKPLVDYVVQDDSDGNGPYISQWNMSDPQPSQTELEAAWAQIETVKPAPTLEERLKSLELMQIQSMGL